MSTSTAVTAYVTVHRQVRSALGVDVDEGIRALLEALWANGMVTEFSCQGGGGHPAHICFTDVADAHRFMAASRDLVITVGAHRAWVDFPPSLLPDLTAYWTRSPAAT